MKHAFQSGFAADIERMLMFKESLGHRRDSYVEGLRQFDRFCAESYPGESLLARAVVDDFSAGANGIPRSPECLKAAREFGKYLASTGQDAYVIPAGVTRQLRPDAPARLLTANCGASLPQRTGWRAAGTAGFWNTWFPSCSGCSLPAA